MQQLFKIFYILGFLLLYAIPVNSQGAKILNEANIGKLPAGQIFTFLEKSTDTTHFKYVATIQGKDRIRNENIENLYYVIREKANKLGANCFTVKEFFTDEVNSEIVLIFDTYYATDSLIDYNRSNHERNVLYFFGNEKTDSKSVVLNVNDDVVEIQPGKYHKIKLKEGEKVKVNKGGWSGTTGELSFHNDQLPQFYTLSGFGLSSLDQQPRNGLSFKTAGINRIQNRSLGLLMVHLLTQN